MVKKREKADDLFNDMVKDVPKQKLSELHDGELTDSFLEAFTVRLPQKQKELLERYLWQKKGQKLASGVRSIITEWMNQEDIL